MGPTDSTLKWFDDLLAQSKAIPRHLTGRTRMGLDSGQVSDYEQTAAAKWVTEAESALKSVFRPGDALLARWDAALTEVNKGKSIYLADEHVVDTLKSVFEAAHSMLKAGRLSRFIEGIRAETVDELLDQADVLLSNNHHLAAAVVAGGALETLLHYLCVQDQLTWPPPGSIEKYRGALDKSRNDGKEIITATDGKLVGAWGGLRNDAAHDPTGAFAIRTPAEVRGMIDGIRQFLARYQ